MVQENDCNDIHTWIDWITIILASYHRFQVRLPKISQYTSCGSSPYINIIIVTPLKSMNCLITQRKRNPWMRCIFYLQCTLVLENSKCDWKCVELYSILIDSLITIIPAVIQVFSYKFRHIVVICCKIIFFQFRFSLDCIHFGNERKEWTRLVCFNNLISTSPNQFSPEKKVY